MKNLFKQKISHNQIIQELKLVLPQNLQKNLISFIEYEERTRTEDTYKLNDKVYIIITLKHSTPEAHKVIKDLLKPYPNLETLLLDIDSTERIFKVFCLKFRNIQSHYNVIHGEDIFKTFVIDTSYAKFICEQSLRNLKLRLKHYYMASNDKAFYSYTKKLISPLFDDLAEILRIEQLMAKLSPGEIIEALEKLIQKDLQFLTFLIEVKNNKSLITDLDIHQLYAESFNIIDSLLLWIEEHWSLN
mgnify:CR=1 FL=1